MASSKTKFQKYSVACTCGHKMRVRKHHFGRMCRCTQCKTPIYVTYDQVTPPVPASERKKIRSFSEDAVPLTLETGDLLMELYQVREQLGEGAFGTVYRVYHRRCFIPRGGRRCSSMNARRG